eukprot:TRINITY_DN2186_c0_g1_i1.p1 TRINITY_DN2186_c0_g1~~TRINITY_DN2186_c0_g1_i1.p1  ORF type:complete len:858 (+),score=180.85 TRINITY_DN2186_c0_g1_i1:88-2661(+)
MQAHARAWAGAASPTRDDQTMPTFNTGDLPAFMTGSTAPQRDDGLSTSRSEGTTRAAGNRSSLRLAGGTAAVKGEDCHGNEPYGGAVRRRNSDGLQLPGSSPAAPQGDNMRYSPSEHGNTPDTEQPPRASRQSPRSPDRMSEAGTSAASRITGTTEARQRELIKEKLAAGSRNRRRCGVEHEDVQRDTDVRLYAMLCAAFSVAGLFLNCLNYGLIPPPALEDRDAGCAGCPEAEQPAVSDQETAWFIFLQSTVSLLTLLGLVFCVLYHMRLFRDEREKAERLSEVPPQFCADGGFIRRAVPLLVELAVIAPHPVVFYARRRAFVYVTCWMFLRLFTVARWLGLQSVLYRRRFDVFSQHHLRGKFSELVVDWRGVWRCLLIHSPATCVMTFTGVCLFSSAVMVFFAERNDAGITNGTPYENLADSMWFTFITYTTIGYGDMFPGSNLGRIVTCVAGVIGVIVANMVAGVLAIRMAPTPYEGEMLQWLDKQGKIEAYRTSARQLVASYWRNRLKARKSRPDILPLEGRAWNPNRWKKDPVTGIAPEKLAGDWKVGDSFAAAADIKRSLARDKTDKNGKPLFLTIPKGTRGTIVPSRGKKKKKFVSVDWGEPIGVTTVRPGEDIANLANECNFIKFVSQETRQCAKVARIARERKTEIDGSSSFDAEAMTKEIQTLVKDYSQLFHTLEAQAKSAMHSTNQIYRASAIHRHDLQVVKEIELLTENEWHGRELIATQGELMWHHLHHSCGKEAAQLRQREFMNQQLFFITQHLRSQGQVTTAGLSADLALIKKHLKMVDATSGDSAPGARQPRGGAGPAAGGGQRSGSGKQQPTPQQGSSGSQLPEPIREFTGIQRGESHTW